MSRRFFDDHMWLSVGHRAKKSWFTRAQRLGVCMATLFLSMITNCMFYKDASEQTVTAPLFSLGPISITGTQIYNSFMSSLIVLPPMIAITMLFSKSAPSNKPEGSYNNKNNNNNNNQNAAVRVKGQWPHWCCHVGWTLVALAMIVSAFFTILYSMQWGKVKAIHGGPLCPL